MPQIKSFTTQISIPCETDLQNDLIAIARTRSVSMAHVARGALKEYIATHSDEIPAKPSTKAARNPRRAAPVPATQEAG